jgi:hypothetical protein
VKREEDRPPPKDAKNPSPDVKRIREAYEQDCKHERSSCSMHSSFFNTLIPCRSGKRLQGHHGGHSTPQEH